MYIALQGVVSAPVKDNPAVMEEVCEESVVSVLPTSPLLSRQ